MLTFSPSGEKVNTNMVLVHREVKMSTLGKIVNNHPSKDQMRYLVILLIHGSDDADVDV